MTVFRLQSQVCKEQEKSYPEMQPISWAFQRWCVIWSNALFSIGALPQLLSRLPDANQWAAIQKSVFFPSFYVCGPSPCLLHTAQPYCRDEILFPLGFFPWHSLLQSHLVVFTCKLLINLTLWSPLKQGRNIITLYIRNRDTERFGQQRQLIWEIQLEMPKSWCLHAHMIYFLALLPLCL